jgi:dephospho-CoA kinase
LRRPRKRRSSPRPRRCRNPKPLRTRATSSSRRAPVSVAITGGIGAGKSEALKAFARHGAAVVSSDEIVHHLLRADPEVRSALVERLGEGILGEDGEIDRGRVGALVFGESEALAWLEGLLHPKVSAEYLRWREQLAELPNPPAVTVTEVPLLYEVGAQDRFDKVVVITAPAKLREARARVPTAGRSDRLLPEREKVKRGDYVYVNTGTLEELDSWVAALMKELRALPAPAPR